MATTKTKYPECEKWAKVSDNARIICEFLEWVEHQDDIVPKSPEETAMLFYGIDSGKVNQEREAMIGELQQ